MVKISSALPANRSLKLTEPPDGAFVIKLYSFKAQELKAVYVNQKVRRRSLAPNRYTVAFHWIWRFAAKAMMKNILAILFVLPATVSSQWLDSRALQSAVLLEERQGNDYVAFGTGAVLWNYFDKRYPIVVTAGHLLNRNELFVSVNADSSFATRLHKEGIDTIQFDMQKWVLSENRFRTRIQLTNNPQKVFLLDEANNIGCFLIDLPSSGVRGSDTLRFSKLLPVTSSRFRKRSNLSLGDDCYLVSFPFGIGTPVTLEPVIRSGSIASHSFNFQSFLFDGFSLPGNEGSPVFSKITPGRKSAIPSSEESFFFGIVTGSLVQNSQNIGLAICAWADPILELTRRVTEIAVSH